MATPTTTSTSLSFRLKLVPSLRQAADRFNHSVLGVIREMSSTSGTTLPSIAYCLTRRGVSTRTSRTTWHPTQVGNILRHSASE
jgi:hypothetical protein